MCSTTLWLWLACGYFQPACFSHGWHNTKRSILILRWLWKSSRCNSWETKKKNTALWSVLAHLPVVINDWWLSAWVQETTVVCLVQLHLSGLGWIGSTKPTPTCKVGNSQKSFSSYQLNQDQYALTLLPYTCDLFLKPHYVRGWKASASLRLIRALLPSLGTETARAQYCA